MRNFDPIPETVDRIAGEIVDAAFAVHTALGPGLLESVYETCLCQELAQRAIKYRTQVTLPIEYKGVRLESGLRLDLVVADSVIAELKAVEKMLPVFEAQLLTYLRLARLRLGLLINFNTPLLKTGIRRIVL
ncbi:MAG: GxxExxY protein [Candidatus Binataceae bacterium]